MAMSPEEQKAFDDMKNEHASMRKLLDDATKPPVKAEPPKDDPSLLEKTRLEEESKKNKEVDSKKIEAALLFNLSSKTFVEQHKDLLPKEIENIFATADKETFDNQVDKANEIKSGVIQSFFAIEENVQLLTPSHKVAIDDYLKLTKNGKRDKAQEIYMNVFEPALAILKGVKKAEEVSKARNGHSAGTDTQKAYQQRLFERAKKHFLGEK